MELPEERSIHWQTQNAHQGALPDLQHVLTLCCTAGSEAVYELNQYAVNERWLAAP